MLELTLVDAYDDEAVDRWWDIYAAAERADRGADTAVWTRNESRHELRQRSRTVERRAYLALSDGVVVGSGRLALPLRDNLRTASLGVHVAPDMRRRGTGSEVLAALESAAGAAGRDILTSTASWPYDAGLDGTGVPGREFARRHGYALALGDVQSRLRLPVDDDLLGALAADAAAHSTGYALRSWIGSVPQPLVHGWAELDAAVETEAPVGDLDLEPGTVDVDAVRADEALLARQNRRSFGTAAVDASGRVVAYTQLVVSGDDGNAYQWGTLVRREARGHRLGMAVKVANLRMLQEQASCVRSVYTYNAGVNEHMLRINRRLGFVPSEHMGEFQKKI
ncbi:GNAT superfamily N-acetyltransferase [Microbacterium ginsengiterrae]|uniref:GNAT superfamily N-acetyltransferase n=1 Tax=Microbacterium ginsengiterrae TaxID=546115 RepID=A0A7W9CDI2_9MICO|nr:GNAT family N-acetyltransferase [Microbacterium ginsengiterrae]MBB5743312.1 GNAT superfamily N-acetyltransferase [Microbacterium ginsengiterrae]